MDNRYDAVIIGSGLGGLECGLILSMEGYNVCVLEQSAVFGGCLQSFTRKGRSIDTGIHYIGSMDDGQIMRQYLRYFGIFDNLSVVKLDDDFDVISLGAGSEFSYRHGYDGFIASLAERFPAEKEGLSRYCAKLKEIGSSIGIDVHRTGRFSSGCIDNLSVPAEAFIGDCVSDPILRNILAGTNVLYGGVRGASNLYHHAMINHSNIEGAYRFVGGTQRVSDIMVARIRANGGTVLNRSKVTDIIAEGSQVRFAELAGGERIYGKYFISDIHPASTFDMLGPTPAVKKAYRTRLASLPNTYGLFSVYLLMKPRSFPYLNKNYYYYRSGDVWDTVLTAPAFEPRSIMLSTQLADRDSRSSDVVTLMSPIDGAIFDGWSGTSAGDRDGAYDDLKRTIADKIIDYSSGFCSGLKGAVEAVYTASPLTYRHYTGTPGGSAYGILKDYRHTISTLLPVRTKLDNLYLTGQNLNVHGALGVTLTAATTCAELLGTEYLAKKIGGI